MERIAPPFPAPDISPTEKHRLLQLAVEVEFKSWELIKDIFGTDEYVEGEELEDWLWDQGGQRILSKELGYEFLNAGADRVVFGLPGYVLKLEFRGDSNSREWAFWNDLNSNHDPDVVWLTRPYAISPEETVIVMERLEAAPNTSEFRRLVSDILDQETWMDRYIYDTEWSNWGYRRGSATPVILDYGH